MSTLSAGILLFLIMDPLGNIPLFLSLLKNVTPERRRLVLIRELLIALVVLFVFLFGGKYLLSALQLKPESVSIAGGIVLFLIGIRMIFPSRDGIFGGDVEAEPFIVPPAIPAIAGPSALATVMLMASRTPDALPSLVVAVSVAMLVTVVVLAAADRIHRVIGERGVLAMERLMGLVLTALAVEMLLSGIRAFVAQLGR